METVNNCHCLQMCRACVDVADRGLENISSPTDPDGANEKGLLSCPTADGVEVIADSVLAVPGPEKDKIRTL